MRAEARIPTGFVVPRIAPVIAHGLSIGSKSDDDPGTIDDGPDARVRSALAVFGEFGDVIANTDLPIEDFNDVISGGEGDDIVFGGGGRDLLKGGGGSDYLDGGVERDEVYGEGGDDVVRGGANDDVVHGDYMYALGSARADVHNPLFGDEGIDQVYGDEGSDFLFGDAGRNDAARRDPSWVQRGQRLWGGDGIDFLYAFANVGVTAAPAAIAAEVQLWGDELHGGAGGDWLYGNLRRDVLFGDSGNEYIAGDYLAGAAARAERVRQPRRRRRHPVRRHGRGPAARRRRRRRAVGRRRHRLAGRPGRQRHALRRRRHRHDGARHAARVLRARRRGRGDTLPPVTMLEQAIDTFDGHYGNECEGRHRRRQRHRHHADRGHQPARHILIGQLADGRIHVDFQTVNPITGAHEAWQILAPWRANVVDPR